MAAPGQPNPGTQIVEDALRQQADQVRIARQPGVDTVERVGRDRGAADVVQTFEQPNPSARPGQVGGGDQPVVAAAHDDDVEALVGCHGQRSAQISLDLVRRAHRGQVGVLTRFAQRPALAQQVPALVKLNFHRAQPLVFLRLVDFVMLHLGAEFLLLGDELVDLGENVTILVHPTSLPDYGVSVASDKKPDIEFPDGPAPAELVIEDVTVGDGAEAVPGGTVKVHYVGVEYDTARSSTAPGTVVSPSSSPCAD